MRLPGLWESFCHRWGTYHPPENTHGREAFQVYSLRTVGTVPNSCAKLIEKIRRQGLFLSHQTFLNT